MLDRFYKDRRRAQTGTTLVELLVSLVIIGLALVLALGAFSTGLLNATLAKRNVAVEAVVQYELDKIGASQFSSSPQAYSECFTTQATDWPQPASGPGGSCPAGSFSLRADVTVSTLSPTRQQWSIKVVTWPAAGQTGLQISTLKVNP